MASSPENEASIDILDRWRALRNRPVELGTTGDNHHMNRGEAPEDDVEYKKSKDFPLKHRRQKKRIDQKNLKSSSGLVSVNELLEAAIQGQGARVDSTALVSEAKLDREKDEITRRRRRRRRDSSQSFNSLGDNMNNNDDDLSSIGSHGSLENTSIGSTHSFNRDRSRNRRWSMTESVVSSLDDSDTMYSSASLSTFTDLYSSRSSSVGRKGYDRGGREGDSNDSVRGNRSKLAKGLINVHHADGTEQVATVRELVRLIETANIDNKELPSYVPTLEDLGPASLSWNKRKHVIRKKNGIRSPKRNGILKPLNTHAAHGDQMRNSDGHMLENSLSRIHKDHSNGDDVLFDDSSTTVSLNSMTSTTSDMSSSQASSVNRHIPSLNSSSSLSGSMKNSLSGSTLSRKINPRPMVNIIGSHWPTELILAKADDRIKKQLQHKKAKTEAIKKQLQDIEKTIKMKQARAERYKQLKIVREQQRRWLILIHLLSYPLIVNTHYLHVSPEMLKGRKMQSASMFITRLVKGWYLRHIFRKYVILFKKTLGKHKSRLRLALRIHRKRRAVEKISTFLMEFRNHDPVKLVVHRFLLKIKRSQKALHDFLACKRGRLAALVKIWNKWEVRYIRKRLQEREHGVVVSKESKFTDLHIDDKTRIEMSKQEEKWREVDKRMAEELEKNRVKGFLKLESSMEKILSMTLPESVRDSVLISMIEKARRAHYVKSKAEMEEYVHKISGYKEEDAALVLKGMNHMVLEKGMHRANKIYNPLIQHFNMFKYITVRSVVEKLKECHEVAGTFVMKIDGATSDVNNSRRSSSTKPSGTLSRSTTISGDEKFNAQNGRDGDIGVRIETSTITGDATKLLKNSERDKREDKRSSMIKSTGQENFDKRDEGKTIANAPKEGKSGGFDIKALEAKYL